MPRLEQVLEDGPVHRLLLRLGPAVDRDDERCRAASVGAVQPGRDLAPVEARIADELRLAQLERREPGGPALGDGLRVTGLGLDDVDLGRTGGLVPGKGEPRAVPGEREARPEHRRGALAEASAPAGRLPRSTSRTRTRAQPSSFSIQASTRPSAEPASSSMSRSGVSTHSRVAVSREWNARPVNSRPSSVTT